MQKHVNIVGWYGKGNIGDESFRTVLVKELGSSCHLEFTNLPNPKADLIIYGGGGVINSTTLRGLGEAKCPRYALGVDMPASGSLLEEIKAHNFDEIWCRSEEYSWLLRRHHGLNVHYAPDLAFALNPPNAPPSEKKVLGVILTPELKSFGSVKMHLINALRYLGDHEVRFISFYSGSGDTDQIINKDVADAVGVVDLRQPETVEEALREIDACTLLWTMRFHGLVFATVVGTPVLGLANKGKFSQFVEQESLHRHWVELKEVTEYKLIRSATYLESSGWHLRDTTTKNQETLSRLFSQIKKTWLGSSQ